MDEEQSLAPVHSLEPEKRIDPDLRREEEELIDDLVQRALLAGDPNIVFGYVREVTTIGRLKAYGTARAIYQTWKMWPKFQEQGIGDDWESVAPAMCGLSLDQCERYRDIYRDIMLNEDVPEWTKPYLAGKSMTALYALLAPVRESEFDEDDWQDVVDAVNAREVKAKVRDVRGHATSSKTRTTMLEDRNGIVRGRKGDGPPVVVANFRSSREDLEGDDYESEVRRTCIARLRRAGVMQR